MTAKGLLDQIVQLPIDQRIKLVEDIWDSIAATPESVPVPESHRAELDRRLDHPSSDPKLSWEEVQSRLRRRG